MEARGRRGNKCKTVDLKLKEVLSKETVYLNYWLGLKISNWIKSTLPPLCPSSFTDISLGRGMRVQSLGQEDPPEEGIATHSSILAWRIQWTEKPGWLESIGLQRVGKDWSDWASTHLLKIFILPNIVYIFCCNINIPTKRDNSV